MAFAANRIARRGSADHTIRQIEQSPRSDKVANYGRKGGYTGRGLPKGLLEAAAWVADFTGKNGGTLLALGKLAHGAGYSLPLLGA